MSLKITPVNVAQDKKRIFLGIEADFFRYVAISCMGSVGLFILLDGVDLLARLAIALTPFTLVLLCVILFLNGKPPCYLKDFIAQHGHYLTKFNTEPSKGWKKPL